MKGRELSLFLLIGAIWGSEWLFVRNLHSPVLLSLALRYVVAACVTAAIALLRRSSFGSTRHIGSAALSGITFLGLPAILTSLATTRISPALLVVTLSMTPLIAALIEGCASGTLLLALVGGVGGTALLASQGLAFSLDQALGAFEALTAAVLVAGSVVWMRRSLLTMPILSYTALQLFASAASLAAASLTQRSRGGLVWNARECAIEGTLALLSPALTLPSYYWLLRRKPSFLLTTSYWLAMLVGVCEGLAITAERPGWRLVAGGLLLMLSGAAILSGAQIRNQLITLQLT